MILLQQSAELASIIHKVLSAIHLPLPMTTSRSYPAIRVREAWMLFEGWACGETLLAGLRLLPWSKGKGAESFNRTPSKISAVVLRSLFLPCPDSALGQSPPSRSGSGLVRVLSRL